MRRQLRLIANVAWKDGRLFLSDRRAVALCFAVPILLATVFGLIFDRPGQRMGNCRLPLFVVVEDHTPFAQQVLADLLASEHLEARQVDRATAEAEIARRGNGIAVILPVGFSHGPLLQQKGQARPAIEMLHHPLSRVESQWAEGVLTEIVMKQAAKAVLAPLGIPPSAATERPFSLQRTAIPSEANHPFNAFSHSFSGMCLQYLLFWGMESGLLLLRERQRSIWKRLRASPIPLAYTLLGRAMATAIIALAQVALTFTFGYLFFNVQITGSLVGFFLLAILVSCLAAALGLFVAAIGGTESRARHLFIVVILGISMLGGLWLPAFLLPEWVRNLSDALPTSWAMRALDGVTWQGLTFQAITPALGMITGFTGLFVLVAMVRFYRMETRLRRGEIA